MNETKLFKNRNSEVKIKNADEVSENLKACSIYVPADFQRRSRGLDDLAFWKGTVYRQVILYTGPVVFESIGKKKYEHFLKLHLSMRIFSDKTSSTENLKFAENQIEIFVQDFAKIYGKDMISHNIHALTHLSDDVQRHGCLDDFSCFVFESYLYNLKKDVTRGSGPLVLEWFCTSYESQRIQFC